MVKSTIHDNSKLPEGNFGYPMQPPEKPAFMANTPTRRAPRMSEPMQFESSLPTKPFEYKPQQNDPANDSPGIQKRFRDPKDFESQFFKNRQGSATTIDEKEGKEPPSKFEGNIAKSEIWSKSSLGKKRTVTVNDFQKIR
jgi:hypothetical protein